MKSLIICIATSVALLIGSSVSAEESLLESVVTGCKVELEAYCKDVTPGESRVIACLYARNDKLSGKCEYAIYDAAIQLQRAVAALSYLVNECSEDLNKFCYEVEAGEGRLLECLGKNDKDVSMRCKDALGEVVSTQ